MISKIIEIEYVAIDFLNDILTKDSYQFFLIPYLRGVPLNDGIFLF